MSIIQNAIMAFFLSWQLRGVLLLIIADLGLGIAASLARSEFKPELVANFYRTNVAPYVLGYLTLYVSVRVIMPPGSVPGLDTLPLNEAAVSIAWLAIVVTLGKSILTNFYQLYQAFLPKPQP